MTNADAIKKTCAAVLIAAAGGLGAQAQEFRATVEVNSQQIEGTNKNVFETLKEALNTYMNETKFSDATFSPNEKIECRLFFTIAEYSDDRMKGDLQVQLSRPVYNSTYTTTLFNFRDQKIEFDYREGDPLIYNESMSENNLTAILDYYANLLLAIDFDSFSPLGGQRFYDRAQSIVQQQQSSGEIGWRTFEDNKNRAAVLGAFTDPSTRKLRELTYQYHLQGLDQMSVSPDKGRKTIDSSLDILTEIQRVSPMSVGLSLFRDAKLDELVNIYSKATPEEHQHAYDVLSPIYPTDTDRIEKIKKGDENAR